MKHQQPCRADAAEADQAAADRDIALAARIAALELAVETLLSRELRSIGAEEALLLKADLLARGGYVSAETEYEPRRALASAAAAELQHLLDRASA